jgi:hypothetical protein
MLGAEDGEVIGVLLTLEELTGCGRLTAQADKRSTANKLTYFSPLLYSP